MTASEDAGRPVAALATRGLGVARGRRTILRDVDLDLAPGLVHGIVGPNGAGKSTLLLACAGLLPSTGAILVGGVPLAALGVRERARHLAFLPQDLGSDADLTGRAVVELGRFARLPRFGGPTDADVAAVEDALTRTGAHAWSDRPLARTSGGERQLTGLARTLAQDADLLFLDEPLAALDIGRELAVLRLLTPWVRDRAGRAAVVVLHDLTLAARFCDRLTLLSGGTVAAHGTPEQVLTPDLLERAYGVRVDVSPVPATGTLAVTPL